MAEREEVEHRLRDRFGFLWVLVDLELKIRCLRDPGASYVDDARAILAEWAAPATEDVSANFPHPEEETT
jgi:hypothetical protein